MRFLLKCCILFLITATSLNAQAVYNLETRVENDQVWINFDLVEKEDIRERFDIEVYYLKSRFSKPILAQSLHGEVHNTSIGPQKKILWNAGKDLNQYDGKMRIKVVAKQVYTPMHARMVRMRTRFRYDRPKSIKLSWSGGSRKPMDWVYVDLYAEGKLIQKGIKKTRSNKGSVWVNTPIQRGSDYQFCLRDDYGSKLFVTPEFRVGYFGLK
ncbi:hypothetical protein [Algivirga pacifica]|uniref:Uncharacterized protein n=1 Tax=Algivirga pacifica TaxID=1162670 RepID=A0ABP9DGV8_9BACT